MTSKGLLKMNKIVPKKIIKFLKLFGLSSAIIGMAWVIWLQVLLSLGNAIHLVPDPLLYDVNMNPFEVVIFVIGLGAVCHYWGVECGFEEREQRLIRWIKSFFTSKTKELKSSFVFKIQYLLPFGLGYYFLTKDYFRVEVEDVLENLVLYFVIGVLFGITSYPYIGLIVLIISYVLITFLEYRLIKTHGHLFPKIFDWDQVQNNEAFTLEIFYTLMVHSFYSCLFGMVIGVYIVEPWL